MRTLTVEIELQEKPSIDEVRIERERIIEIIKLISNWGISEFEIAIRKYEDVAAAKDIPPILVDLIEVNEE